MPYTNTQIDAGIDPNSLSAEVVIGDILPDDEDAVYADTGDDLGIFTDYKIENTYVRDLAILAGGITQPTPFQDQSVAFVQMNAPMLTWVCNWTACRFKDKPIAPSSVPSDPRWVLIREEHITFNVGVAPDGTTPLYRLSGKYTYVHRSPDRVGIEAINFPRLPVFDDAFERRLASSDFVTNLMDVVTGSEGSQKKGTGN